MMCFSEGILPAAGLEPARGHPQQILRLPRLPFRHAGLTKDSIRTENNDNIFAIGSQVFFEIYFLRSCSCNLCKWIYLGILKIYQKNVIMRCCIFERIDRKDRSK